MSEYKPIGYVACVAYDAKAGGYFPLVHFYQPGKPVQIIWAGVAHSSFVDALAVAEANLHSLVLPGPDDVLLALRNVLEAIASAGNLMAITHSNAVQGARTLVAKLG